LVGEDQTGWIAINLDGNRLGDLDTDVPYPTKFDAWAIEMKTSKN
jgi:hypothetical protein